MTPQTMPASTHRFRRRIGQFLIVVGIISLGYVVLALVDAKLFQEYQSRQFQNELISLKSSIENAERLPPVIAKSDNRDADTHDGETLDAETHAVAPPEGSPLGRLEISSVGLEVMILEGIEERTLQRGAGHIPGTALPGQSGNVAIAGHRDTFFRPLREIRQNDEILLTTLNRIYRYRVDSTKIVSPQEIGVLYDSGEAILTLVTCYPFQFVGSAPQRFIVRAHRL